MPAMTTTATTARFPSCRLLLAVALLLCAAATTQGQGEAREPRTKFISYAAPSGRSPECLQKRVPPFCRGKSAITARRSPGVPAPVVRRTPAPAELEANAAAAAAAEAPPPAAGPLCFVYSNGRRLCVPTE